ncbi:uncharacterized protein LOC130014521 [Mercurialis annua]|uniref:uncharacterized protein LOC130014521 n=1 Tax=Mercurialis annua TaxID=3986 RepID=UPI00215ED6B2|nr:uncharacterized protein LOC130014521 [Mercurialis annua]
MNMNVYHENQTVEIIEGPLFGSYRPATVLAREEGHPYRLFYKIQYLTRFNDDDSPLTEVVHVRVIRPIPPEFVGYRNFELNDIVDAYNYDIGAWQAGTVIGNVENLDHHLVRLFDQTERLAPYIRFHAEWFPLPCYVFWRPTDEYTHNPVTDPQPSATD